MKFLYIPSILSVLLLQSCQNMPDVTNMMANQMLVKQPSRAMLARQNTRAVTQAAVKKDIAITLKNANIRSGPGSKNKKVGRLVTGTQMDVLETKGNWLKIHSGSIDGWVYAPLVKRKTITVAAKATASSQRAGIGGMAKIHYAGYSKDFLTVKKMMRTGDLKSVQTFFDKREEKIRKETKEDDLLEKIGLLRWMERGTLGLDTNSIDTALKGFTNAERILDIRQDKSKLADGLGSILSFAADSVAGSSEFSSYDGEGFEKVLMLNYKSIGFLLNGERQAYNTTRRAIDWQNIEKDAFAEKISEAKNKEKKQDTKDVSADGWQKEFNKHDKIANSVASAYVNPFGYYVAGMVQEFESKSDRSLRDNARISYTEALKLNPNSSVLKQAVKDMKQKYDKNKRLVHIVVGDGFVPEKKMMVYNIPSSSGIIPVKLPIYEPVKSLVSRVEVQTSSGKRLARLSTVADIEAITLRHQKDTEGFRALRVAISIARAVAINEGTKQFGIFGKLAGTALNSLSAPDMRSWMSLPAKLNVARLKLSKNIKSIKIVSFDAKGKKLASKTVKINTTSDNFIYARSIDKQLYTNVSKKLWL